VVERLRETLGAKAPDAVKFVPGTVPEPSRIQAEETLRQPVVVTEEGSRRGAELAAPIAGEELRRAVARAAAVSLQRAAAARGF
jgi:hypothetical protein